MKIYLECVGEKTAWVLECSESNDWWNKEKYNNCVILHNWSKNIKRLKP